MGRLTDTIAAPITPPGRGAVAAARVSGPEALACARRAFPRLPARPEPRKAVYGPFAHGDDGFALPFEAAASYTGETAVELFVHGSAASVEGLMRGLIAAGARTAEPGEFTLRAFLNGRIDLTQAEAVAETVDALGEAHLRAAGGQRSGALKREVAAALEPLDRVYFELEARLDFAEELGPPDASAWERDLARAEELAGELLRLAPAAEIVRRGLRVAIVGRPNAGKSSLFNRLLGAERAIVHPVAGTTRDLLEHALDLDGRTIVLQDSAGIRRSRDAVETEGAARAGAAAETADLRLYLFDAAAGCGPADRRILARLPEPTWVFAAKADLPHPPSPFPTLSSHTGQGLAELLARLALQAGTAPLPYLVNPRHVELLHRAREALGQARGDLIAEAPIQLAIVALADARRALRTLTGEEAGPDVLEAIFSRFCVGK